MRICSPKDIRSSPSLDYILGKSLIPRIKTRRVCWFMLNFNVFIDMALWLIKKRWLFFLLFVVFKILNEQNWTETEVNNTWNENMVKWSFQTHLEMKSLPKLSHFIIFLQINYFHRSPWLSFLAQLKQYIFLIKAEMFHLCWSHSEVSCSLVGKWFSNLGVN